MYEINKESTAHLKLREIQKEVIYTFPNQVLIGVEMGVAYGGGLEEIGRIWKGRGHVFGYDTFEGHPKELAEQNSPSANCMDSFYQRFGKDKLSIDYIQNQLIEQGINNVILCKGLVQKWSCEFLHRIHYCLLDLDILESMKTGYEAVKDRIVPGGYLCLHDVVGISPPVPGLKDWYAEIKKDWKVIYENDLECLAILRK